MQAMVETLESAGFDVKKFYDTNLKGYRFTIRKNDCFTSALFEYPADTSREYCDARQREFIDYIINKWHDDHCADVDIRPKTYITTAGDQYDKFRKRMLNYTYGKFGTGGDTSGHYFVNLNGLKPEKVELLPADHVRSIFEQAKSAGVLKSTFKKIPEITQEDIDKMLLQPAFDMRDFIQRQLYNAILKGENKMNEAAREYMHRDIAGAQALADAMRNVNRRRLPGIKTVHFSGPVTAVIWEDKTKTLVRCKDGEEPDYEKGLAMAIAKKALGTNKSGSNYYDIFKKWLPKNEENTEEVTE
jgi:hypothetical protein